MPTWLVPTRRWEPVDHADDEVRTLRSTGHLLAIWPPGQEEQTPTYCYRLGGNYWIWQPDFGGLVFSANSPDLILKPLPGISHDIFETLVSRSWVPALYPIWQRQVLHASAVSTTSGDVIAFTGPSGACKSTTAFAAAQRGNWTMVADDTLAFSVDADSRIALHPLRREACLRQATAEYFGKAEPAEIPFTWPTTPLSLKIVYILCASDDPTVQVRFDPLRAAEIFPLLLAQAYALSLGDPAHNQRLMRDYLALAAAVRVFRFTFPKRFDHLALTLQHLDVHAAAHGVHLSNGPATSAAVHPSLA